MRFEIFPILPLWQALRRYSLTFSIVFATAILGFSVMSLLRRILRELSIPWLWLWVLPFVFVAAVAQKEKEWIPDFTVRRKWATGIALGSIILALGLGQIRQEPERPEEAPSSENQFELRERRSGPRGK